jgi:hypothetical protein
MSFRFEIEATDGKARAGRMATPHGEVQAPEFVPVGTLERRFVSGHDFSRAASRPVDRRALDPVFCVPALARLKRRGKGTRAARTEVRAQFQS